MIKNKDIPEPNKDQVSVKIAYCGVCGTDKIMAKNWCKDWIPFGHEVSGIIYKVGKNVNDFFVGQKVAVKPGAFCGECPACKKGFFRTCSKLVTIQGGFAEYITVDKRSIAVAPDSMCLKALSLTEPLNVAIDILETAKINDSDSVVLFGPGLIGMMSLYLAKNLGASVKAVIGREKYDYLEHHIQNLDCAFIKSKKPSTIDSILARKLDWISQIEQITSNLTSRLVVIHTAPPYLINSYIKYLPYESCIVNIGLTANNKHLLIDKLNMRDLMFKRIQLMSSFAVPSLHFDKAVDFLNSGIINADNFIDKIINLNDISKYLKPSGLSTKFMKLTVKLFSEPG